MRKMKKMKKTDLKYIKEYYEGKKTSELNLDKISQETSVEAWKSYSNITSLGAMIAALGAVISRDSPMLAVVLLLLVFIVFVIFWFLFIYNYNAALLRSKTINLIIEERKSQKEELVQNRLSNLASKR